MPRSPGIVTIGAGQAAAELAVDLRRQGYAGPITLVGDEPYVPYQRPPLSKQYLSGEHERDRVYLRPSSFYEEKNIGLRLGVNVSVIDRDTRCVALDNGEQLAYDELLIATGGRPRRLAVDGGDLDGIHYLRTIGDVDRIRAEMTPGRRLVIVGGGYIGLEVAAVAIAAGMSVQVLETGTRVLQRVATSQISDFYARIHGERGVGIRTGATVTGFVGNGRVSGVACGTEQIPADIVVVGIGILPNVELAEAAGLACDNGVVIDEACRTSDRHIFAAGDCANYPDPFADRRLRLESVPNAMEQARVAAANMLGGSARYATVPWFWSEQYDLMLQMVGFAGDGESRVLRGDEAADQFVVFHLKDEVVVAADAVNSPREFMTCRKLVGARVDSRRLADTDTELKSLLTG